MSAKPIKQWSKTAWRSCGGRAIVSEIETVQRCYELLPAALYQELKFSVCYNQVFTRLDKTRAYIKSSSYIPRKYFATAMSTTTTTTQSSQATTVPMHIAEHNASVSALSTGGYEFAGVPKINDLYKKRQWQLEHMAGAFRVFARKGFTEGTSGHISVRDPVDPKTFWINP